MARGEGTEQYEPVAVREQGEIDLLDAERLEDQAEHEARSAAGISFGDKDDDQAIRQVMDKLRKTPTGARWDEDTLTEKAIDLYNSLCERIRNGSASSEQVTQTAAMFGEAPAKLKTRLIQTQESSGAAGLLGALARSRR